MTHTILGFETAMNQTQIALLHVNSLAQKLSDGGRGQTAHVLPHIDALLEQMHVTLPELTGLAYSHGPGSFTGLRVAASVIQALSFVHQTPVVGVSSLKALAFAAAKAHGQLGMVRVLVCVDAKMAEVYWAVYDVTVSQAMLASETLHETETHEATEAVSTATDKPTIETVCGDALCSPATFVEQVRAYVTEGAIAAGDGWMLSANDATLYEAAAVEECVVNSACKPSAADVVQLAIAAFEANDTLAATEVMPVYLRDKTAWKTLEEQQQARQMRAENSGE